jgi:hypothetical protein
VSTYSHELSRSEKSGLTQIRAVLEAPGKGANKVNADPAADDERRFIDEYVANIEQPSRALGSLPSSWLKYETVIALPIHAPIHFASQDLAAGYRELLIFHPPAAEAVYASHYGSDKTFGPRIVADLGTWLKRHVQLQREEASR